MSRLPQLQPAKSDPAGVNSGIGYTGDEVREFARAAVDAYRASQVPMTGEQFDAIYVFARSTREILRGINEHYHGIGAKP